MDRTPIVLQEQQKLNGEDKKYIDNLDLSYSSSEKDEIPPFLGLTADGWSSYYVGTSWLKEGHRPLVVHPKFDNIDYMGIFSEALSDNVSPSYFQKAYNINLDAPYIEDNTLDAVLTPLLVAHYLSVMRLLLSKGLKRNYIIREENFTNKIRGYIIPLRNLQKNILRGHAEKTLCRFQEYSYDYPENRLLKRGLLAAESLLLSLKVKNNILLQVVRRYLMEFSEISSDITPTAVKSIRRDKLHGDYPEAVKLAKRILQRTDYSIADKSNNTHLVPEFAIDMSRIFEFYVLGLLKRRFAGEKILFQESAGIMGRCDYIVPSECLIIDAKYKRDYLNKDTDIIRKDVREVAGYSRSSRIRSILNIQDDSEITCLIIYPDDITKADFSLTGESLISISETLKGVDNFYILSVPIPTI